MLSRASSALRILFSLSLVHAGVAQAATLPEHAPLRVLVVSDEVNPNGLSDAELTQPGDISNALNAGDSGLNLSEGGATEVSSQCVDDALSALESSSPPDVVVYFAHRGALGCDGQDAQARFTADIEQLLIAGGGLVVFHHGIYAWSGKDEILDLIGGQSNSIAWDTQSGQRIFNVAPDHFVTSNGLDYEQSGAFEGVAGVAAGDYPYFDNTPDERYPDTILITAPDETRQILFASDSGGTRVVGYALSRPGWTGRVVTYQSGEYQPNALDDRDGRNFQILANAILYSTGAEGGTGTAEPSDPELPGQVTNGTDAGTGTERDESNAGDDSTSDEPASDAAADDDESAPIDGQGGNGNDDPATNPTPTPGNDAIEMDDAPTPGAGGVANAAEAPPSPSSQANTRPSAPVTGASSVAATELPASGGSGNDQQQTPTDEDEPSNAQVDGGCAFTYRLQNSTPFEWLLAVAVLARSRRVQRRSRHAR